MAPNDREAQTKRMNGPESRRRFAASRVARLATIRIDGRPHVVPVVFALDGCLIYSIIDAKPKKSPDLVRLANIRRDPHVSLLVDAYDEAWEHLWWVRADGLARVVASGPEYETAILLLRAKYSQYQDSTASFGAAVVIRVEHWRSWAFAQ